MIERGQIANAVQLKNLFEREAALESVGGAQYLARLQASFVTIINAKDYGRTIHDLYLRRQLIDLGEEMVNEAHEHDLEADAAAQIEAAEEQLYHLAETGQTEGGLDRIDPLDVTVETVTFSGGETVTDTLTGNANQVQGSGTNTMSM